MKITIDRDLVEQALEALGSSLYPQPRQMAAIAALKAALESPVQEPYCYVYEYDSPHGLHREFYPREYNGMKPTRTVQVYTAPPQRTAEPVEEPVAWRTFDGEGGWDYRDYELNEDYHNQYIARNGSLYAHWIEPLYTAPVRDNYWQEEAHRYATNCDFWRERYTELIMAVGSKHPGEDRHQTALRYITNAERNTTTRDGVQKS